MINPIYVGSATGNGVGPDKPRGSLLSVNGRQAVRGALLGRGGDEDTVWVPMLSRGGVLHVLVHVQSGTRTRLRSDG